MAKNKSDFDAEAEKVEAQERAAEAALLDKIPPATAAPGPELPLSAKIELSESAMTWNYRNRSCGVWARSAVPHEGWTKVIAVEPAEYATEVGTVHNFRLEDLDVGKENARRRIVGDVAFDKDAWGKVQGMEGVHLNVYGFDADIVP